MANALERMIRRAIHLHDEKYATARFGAGNTHKAPLALPSLGPDAKRILYTIYEYEPLLDSSNMTMDDWINIAKDLRVCICERDFFCWHATRNNDGFFCRGHTNCLMVSLFSTGRTRYLTLLLRYRSCWKTWGKQ